MSDTSPATSLAAVARILDTLEESFLEIDRDWRVTYANRRVLERIGTTREDLIGKVLWDVTPEARTSDFYIYYHRVMTDRVPARFETVYPPTNRCIEVSVFPTETGIAVHARDITDRKLADQRALEFAARADFDRRQLQVVIDCMINSVMVVNASGQLISANPAAVRLHGFGSEEEFLRHTDVFETMFERRFPDGRIASPGEWPMYRALKGEIVRDVEFSVKRIDTGVSWVGSYNASPIYDQQGNVVRAVISVYDLTQRRKDVHALRQSEERFRLLTQAMPQLAWTCMADGSVDFVNDWALSYTGRKPEELTGMGWLSCICPEDVPSVRHKWREAVRSGTPFESEYRIRRAPDGEYRWHLSRAFPLRNEQGAVLKWIGTSTDVEEQKRTETSLRNAAARLTLALAASQMGDWSWDAATDVVTLSDRAAQIFGIPSGPFMTWTNMRDLLHADDRDRARSAVEEAIAKHTDYDIEYRVTGTDRLRWISAKGRALYAPSGEVTGMLGVVQDVTERKKEDEEIRRKEESLRLAQSAARIGSWSLDVQDSSRNYWSAELYNLTGFDPSWKPEYEEWLAHVADEDRQRVHAAIARALAGDANGFNISYRLTGMDGVERWNETRGSIRKDRNGAIIGAHGITMDISERVFVGQALQKANDRAIAILESITDAFYALDDEWRFTYVNSEAERLLARSREQLLGKMIWEEFPEAVPTSFYREFQRAKQDNTAVHFEEYYPPFQSWFGMHVYPSPEGFAVYFENVTERKTAEAERARLTRELEAERGRLRAVIDQMPAGLLIADARTGKTLLANSRVEEIIGHPAVPAESLEDYAQYRAVHPDGGRAFSYREFPLVRSIVDAENVTAEEMHYVRPDGTRAVLSVSSTPIRDAADSVVAGVMIFGDITERKRGEEALRKANTRLKLANTDLEQFAFAAAHDLQEPLRMVITYTQLLERRLDGNLDERASSCMTQIVDGARRMSTLLEDLLAYTETSLEASKPPGVVDLNRVLGQCVQNLERSIHDSGATVSACGHLPLLRARESHLLQVTQNLIANALKYGKPGVAPQVTISAERNGAEWVISVADNGIGIDPVYHQQIFGVFKRLHGREIPGTGIGLAICQRVIERAGGRIWVDSKPGEGSTFHFTLPATD